MKFNFGAVIRKALAEVSFLWLSSLGGAIFVFLTQVVLARELTPTGYGLFAATLATINLALPLAGFGLPGLWLKLFGTEGWGAIRWLSASFRFVFISTVLVLLTLAAWASWGPHDISTQRLFYLLLPIVLGSLCMELVSSKLQLEERYKALALWQLLPNLARLLGVVLVVVLSAQTRIDYIAAAYSLVALTVTMLSFSHLRAIYQGRFTLKGHSKTTMAERDPRVSPIFINMFDVAREALPFGLAGVFYLIYFQSNIILLKYFTGAESAGIYNVAFTVMTAVYLLPTVIYQKFLLPKYHRWANFDRTKFLKVYRFGNGSMLMTGGLTTVVMLPVVPLLIPKLFGAEYQPAIDLLMLLAFCAPVRFLATSVGATLVTQEHMRRKVCYMGIVALINLFLNLLLIPLYAAKGAAVATLMSEVTLLALYLLAVKRHVFGPEAWHGWTVTLRSENV